MRRISAYARVFSYTRNDRVYIAAVVDASEHTCNRCKQLTETCGKYLGCDMTVYLSAPCRITQISDQRLFWEQADINNVVRAMSVVTNAEQLMRQTQGVALDTQALMGLLRRGKPVETVNAMRKTLDAAEKSGQISARTLQSIRHDFTQVVFLYLSQEHILAHELFQEKGAKQLEAACENSVFDMLKWIDYVVKKGIDTVSQTRKSETVVEKIKRYIEANYIQNITLDSLAELSHLNKYYMAHAFTLHYGCSPIRYLCQTRIEASKELLANTDYSITEVAQYAGFSSQSYFAQCFSKSCGVTASAYRKSCKETLTDFSKQKPPDSCQKSTDTL